MYQELKYDDYDADDDGNYDDEDEDLDGMEEVKLTPIKQYDIKC